jgi:hypothetical protein
MDAAIQWQQPIFLTSQFQVSEPPVYDTIEMPLNSQAMWYDGCKGFAFSVAWRSQASFQPENSCGKRNISRTALG